MIPTYTARATGEARGTIVVLQEIFGLNRYIRGVADALAAAGWDAVAPEVFHRNAPGFLAGYDEAGFAAGRAQVAALDARAFQDDIGELRASLPGKVGVLGFCYGGALAWEAAALHPFHAAVSFYGRAHSPILDGIPPLRRSAGLRGPLLAHFAQHDPVIPADAVAACAAALLDAPVPGTIQVWPGVHHGFHCWDRGAWHAPTAAAAWEQTLAHLRAHVG